MNGGRALAVLILSAVGAARAVAQAAPAEIRAETPPANGLVVFVDPVTGKIRQPEPSEIGALTAPKPGTEAAKPAAAPPLQMKYGPGSAVGVVLDGRYESFMVVTKKPDGTLAMDCVTGARNADAAVAAGEIAAGKTGKTAKTATKGKKENEEAVRVP